MTTLGDDFLPVKPFSLLRETLRGLLLFYSGWFFSNLLRNYLREHTHELQSASSFHAIHLRGAAAAVMRSLVSQDHPLSIFGLPLLLFVGGAILGLFYPGREIFRVVRMRLTAATALTNGIMGNDGDAGSTRSVRPDGTPGARSRGIPGRTLTLLLVSALVAFHFRTMVLQRIAVTGESMEPTLVSGGTLWIEKISTGLHLPDLSFPFGPILPAKVPRFWTGGIERGDIVVFLFPAPDGSAMEYYIKRVIALPGDRYAIREGLVFVNGSLLHEDYLMPGTRTENENLTALPGLTMLPEGMEQMSREIRYHALYGCASSGRVPGGTLFVMGDNRAVSRDSRSMGFIPLPFVTGVARWIR